MPYEILSTSQTETRLHLWPHRSLTQRGFVWFVGGTAALIAVPLIGVIGSPVVWALLPFLLGTIWAIWFALRKNGRDRDVVEDLHLTPDRVTLSRHGPKGRRVDWEANPYWLRVTLYASDGPVPNYLTLKGEGREVELGAFLSEDERIAVMCEIKTRIAAMKSP